MEIVAKTLEGFEEILAEEVEKIGGENVKLLKRAVSYEGDLEVLYKSNLHLRTAIRVLVPLEEGIAKNDKQFYKYISSIDWSEFMEVDNTFAVDANVSGRYFDHSKFLALRTKDAVVDQFREKTNKRPSIDVKFPDLRINIFVQEDRVSVSLDSSGSSLHRRGYKLEISEAPLSEVLGAGMILKSEWNPRDPFIDPMCGSGTLLVEAAMIASNTAPNSFRKYFSFMNWKNYDRQIWDKVKKAASDQVDKSRIKIYGGDKDRMTFNIARKNIENAGFGDEVILEKKDFFKAQRVGDKGVLMMNPPYGDRLELDDVDLFYEKIGDKLKDTFDGYDAWILSGNLGAMKKVGLKTARRFTLMNGPLECKFFKYEMYQGSKKVTNEI